MQKVVFIRHGKALPAGEGKKDIERTLGEIGIGQATARRAQLNRTKFDYALTSPAPRATKTAELVTGLPSIRIVEIDMLYPDPHDGGVGARLDKLFNKPELGYTTVNAYLQDEDGACVTEWATDAWTRCENAIEFAGNPDVVGIFGHAVCLPALGMQLCEGEDAIVAQIAELNLGECGGYVVNFDGSGRPVSVETIC